MDFQKVKTELAKFAEERNWDEFHTPKELAIKLTLESAETLELFEWLTKEQVDEILKEDDFREALGDEFADVLRTLLQLSHVCNVDLVEAFERKRERDVERFPLEKSQGFDALKWKLKKIRKHEKVGL